jgi:hypothetical protein
MNLILCNVHDAAAKWAYLQLRREASDAIELVTAEVLACAVRWEHRVTSHGTVTAITLADGRTLRSDQVRATLNRLDHVPPIAARASDAERQYAAAEMHALFASWLHALPGRVWNRATPAGLSGNTWRQSAEWRQLAARAGFAIVPVHQRSDAPPPPPLIERTRLLFVAGEEVLGAAPAALQAAALALSRAANTPLLGIELTHDWRFRSATTHPDLRLGGTALLAALRGQLFQEAA